MSTNDPVATPLRLFTAVCDALEVAPGAARLDAFLKLPDWQQEAILVELRADAEEASDRQIC